MLGGGLARSTTVMYGGAQYVYSGGVANDGSVFGVQDVYSGGLASGTVFNRAGGVENIYTDGVASFTTLSGAASQNVSGGITVSAVLSGPYAGQTVYSGGVTSWTTLSGGGEVVFSGGLASDTINVCGSLDVLEGGVASGATVRGGLEYVSSGGIAIDTTVSSGGGGAGEYVFSGGVTSFTTVSGEGTEYITYMGVAGGTTISSGGTEFVFSRGDPTDTVLEVGGRIAIGYLPYVSGGSAMLDPLTDVLTVSQGGQTYMQQMSGIYSGEYFHLTPGSFSEYTYITVNTTACYCVGTHIRADRGNIAVERLTIGDRVVAANHAPRPIRWIGRRHLDLSRHPEPDCAQPILIRAHAIAAGVPHRDLRVSPDHAILLDDVLIPARLLINGATIRRESACRTVTYYHIELDTHDVLLAENLPAESYLDTGNRGMFENADAPLILHPTFDDGQRRRVAGSCRPFVDDAARVEPIWRRLAHRAAALGHRLPAIETTADPDLRLVVGARKIAPISSDAGRHSFVLPAGTAHRVRLISRATKPCDVRPWIEDRRRLGVMVSRLTLTHAGNVEPIPLDHPGLRHGWWAVELDRTVLWRWTNGSAELPLPEHGPAVLEVTLGGGLDYPVVAASPAPARRPAQPMVA